MQKKLKFYSLKSTHEALVQEIKKPSASSTKGKFDKSGIYHPAKFEHLTNAKYFEYEAMGAVAKPSNWRNKLAADMALTAAEKEAKAKRQKEKEDKEKILQGTRVNLGITDIEQMRTRIIRLQSAAS